MLKFVANKHQEQLSDFLVNNCQLGYFKIKKLISSGQVKVNDVRVKTDVLLKRADNIIVFASDAPKLTVKNVVVVFEDDNVIFVNKSVGQEVEGDKSLSNDVNAILALKGEKAVAVHRLDRNTTGIVCFAKNVSSELELLKAFKEKRVEKIYFALVFGVVEAESQVLSAFLRKDANKSIVKISDKNAVGFVPIETHIKVLEKFETHTKLEVKLISGKTHQIRAHLAHIGHPVLGDGKYSSNEINKKFPYKHQALCAVQICFTFASESCLFALNEKKFSIECSF